MTAPKKNQQRADVQGLRAVAIFAVLLFHFFPEYFPNGYLGVDMFFVISGFLISSILARSTSYSLSTFLSFYFRRSKRILPLYLVYICFAIFLYSVNSLADDIYNNQISTLLAMFFATNINSAIKQEDYFEMLGGDNLFTHTWSLSVEMQYYFFVPFIFLLRSKLPTSSPFHAHFFSVIGLLSMLLTIVTPPLFAFNMVFTRLWQFLSTNVLVIPKHSSVAPESTILPSTKDEQTSLLLGEEEQSKAIEEEDHKKPHVGSVYKWITAVILVLPLIPFVSIHPLFSRVTVVFATASIIVFGKDNENPILASAPFEFIGDVSYTLYLFHWPFTVYFVQSTVPASLVRLSLIPCSLLVTVIIYYLFERHYRLWTKGPTCVFIIAFYAIALILTGMAPTTNDAMQNQTFIVWRNNSELEAAMYQNSVYFYHGQSSLKHTECNYSVFRNESRYNMGAPFGTCTMPNGDGKLKFVVIGNSYAPNQADLVYKHFKPFFGSFRLFSEVSCEILAYTHRPYCYHRANYTDVMHDFRPDVTFIIQRYVAAKNPPHAAGENDTEALEMIEHLNAFKEFSSLFFIMDTLPAPIRSGQMANLNNLIRKGMRGEDINKLVVDRNEDIGAKPRTKKLAESCGSKCHLYDIEPALHDSRGRFIVYDEKTHLALFEPSGHLTDHGKMFVDPFYEALAKQYTDELRALEKKLYG